jgi:hypothetical protein
VGDQGGGIAVADVDGDGQLELDLLLVDNQGSYQLGRGGLGADGTVSGWTGWLGIPGWHSWGNQGADMATAPAGGPSPRQRSHRRGVDQQRPIGAKSRHSSWGRHGGSP